MEAPESMVPRTNMPRYAFLKQPLDTTLSERKMKALKFPYTQADLDLLKGKSEMDAMVAYLQKLGNDIPWRKAASTAVAGNLKNPYKADATIISEGREIYEKNCAACHGVNLEGGVGPALTSINKPDAEIFKIIYSGVQTAGMPSFGDNLGTDRIWKLTTFIVARQVK
jgi:cytochrome c oxidase cbb3-type subunit 2